jgi:hypothetical protein
MRWLEAGAGRCCWRGRRPASLRRRLISGGSSRGWGWVGSPEVVLEATPATGTHGPRETAVRSGGASRSPPPTLPRRPAPLPCPPPPCRWSAAPPCTPLRTRATMPRWSGASSAATAWRWRSGARAKAGPAAPQQVGPPPGGWRRRPRRRRPRCSGYAAAATQPPTTSEHRRPPSPPSPPLPVIVGGGRAGALHEQGRGRGAGAPPGALAAGIAA